MRAPRMTRRPRATEPWRLRCPKEATMSAPQTEPAPEKQSRRVKVPEPPWNTLAAKTGRKTRRGTLSRVIEKARRMSEVMALWVRMKAMPSFMLVNMETVALAGWKRVLMTRRETMTATKDAPLRPKHQDAPRVLRAMPPSMG